jgi:hypothetical protein
MKMIKLESQLLTRWVVHSTSTSSGVSIVDSTEKQDKTTKPKGPHDDDFGCSEFLIGSVSR